MPIREAPSRLFARVRKAVVRARSKLLVLPLTTGQSDLKVISWTDLLHAGLPSEP